VYFLISGVYFHRQLLSDYGMKMFKEVNAGMADGHGGGFY